MSEPLSNDLTIHGYLAYPSKSVVKRLAAQQGVPNPYMGIVELRAERDEAVALLRQARDGWQSAVKSYEWAAKIYNNMARELQRRGVKGLDIRPMPEALREARRLAEIDAYLEGRDAVDAKLGDDG